MSAAADNSSRSDLPSGDPVRPVRDVNADVVAELSPGRRELRAESITLRIRWFGLVVGYLLANAGDVIPAADRGGRQAELNTILTLGAVYAMVDTWWSLRGKVFLAQFRIVVSIMEALFIGLLCYFDEGIESPFRFYYFLSLLVCAIRHKPALTFATFTLHACSYTVLGLNSAESGRGDFVILLLTLVFLAWAAWAVISLTELLKMAERRTGELNDKLRENQSLLEHRIRERTKALQESQALLVQQEKQAAFGLLAAGIAHEVGNPLASISSIVQMLKRRNQDDYTNERLEIVSGQLRRIQRILGELVGFSRPANEGVTVVDIHAAIDNALSIAKYYKRWKGKKVEINYAPDMPPVKTVYDQLVQVVLNLILNALDATEEGACIRVSTSIGERDADGRSLVAISIEDEGHGIPPEAQASIFQPYFTTKSTGTGLGLFVCRQLAENELDGAIELVRSDPSGTEFRILLTTTSTKRPSSVPEPAAATDA